MSVEPETPELDRSRGLLTYLQHFPAGHVQQDGLLQGRREHTAYLQWVHKQEFGGGYPVLRRRLEARLVPLI